MKRLAVTVFVLCMIMTLCGCHDPYRESDFLGKTSHRIVAEFGPFDCEGKAPGADGLYRNTACGYTLQDERTGFLGTEPEWLIFIAFDENGIAHECWEGYRPGG